METRHIADLRAERLIAIGRLTLAALTLFAIWLDPAEPVRLPPLGYAVGALYVGYALVLVAAAWSAEPRLLRFRLATHVVDLVAYAAIIFFTSGATSPFFVFLLFALIAAALRWQWPGVLATAAAALAAYVAIALPSLEQLGATASLTFAVRTAYLAVFAVLLGHLGSHQQRLRKEMAALAALPASPGSSVRLACQLAAHAREVLHADAVALVCAESGDGSATLTRCDAAGVVERRLPRLTIDGIVSPALGTSSFASTDGDSPDAAVLRLEGDRVRRSRLAALAPGNLAELPAGPLLGLHLDGQAVEGWLLASRRRRFTADDLLPGELLARQIAPQLDAAHQRQREQRQAALEERARLARDLHDGAIQSLTGASLRLQAVDRLLDEHPAQARRLLGEIDELLVSEQQELRWFATEPSGGDWSSRLEQLAERMARNWGMYVWIENQVGELLGGDFGHEVYRIVQEGLVNAARHGGARHSRVQMELDGEALRIRITDDGRGFPFQGELDDAALRDRRLGPVSIKQRVAGLAGEIAIRSGDTGARLDIHLPLVTTPEEA